MEDISVARDMDQRITILNIVFAGIECLLLYVESKHGLAVESPVIYFISILSL